MSRSQSAPVTNGPKWHAGRSFWPTAAIVLLLLIPFAASSGIGGILLVLGIVAALTGLYSLIFNRRSWLGLPRRRAGAIAAGVGLALFIAGPSIASTNIHHNEVAALPTASAMATDEASPADTDSPRPTPTAMSPASTACVTEGDTKTFESTTFVCTRGTDGRLIWLNQDASKKIVAERAAAKAAAAKAAADKLAAEKAVAAKAAAARAAADQAAAAKAAADQAAAQQAAQDAAAQQAAQQAPPVQQPPAQQATVIPGAFCPDSEVGVAGTAANGRTYVCGGKGPDANGHYHWNK